MALTSSFEQAVIVLEIEEDCKRCPMSLRCLAGKSLNYKDGLDYNAGATTICLNCYAIHFMVNGQYYVCINIKQGLYLRPLAPDDKRGAAAQAICAVRDSKGHYQSAQTHLCCREPEEDCADMWNRINRLANRHT